MKVVIIGGTGYVGLVTGACLASSGVNVICVDVDSAKVKMLQDGGCPIHEKDLPARIAKGMLANNLSFTTNFGQALGGAEVAFICVGTPPLESGEADLSAVFAAAEAIANNLEGNCIVAQKSTVPVGTGEQIEELIGRILKQRNVDFECVVVSNPEFLKEGNAVSDFESPERVIIGTKSQRAAAVMSGLYQPFMRQGERIQLMSRVSAELSKVAANAMLASRISIMNLFARLCEQVGADVKSVRLALGSDSRIGSKFLYPGVGFGGSCFPKDVRALVAVLGKHNLPTGIFTGVLDVNDSQKGWFCRKIKMRMGELKDLKFAVWGLAFKAGTDDVRESPALEIISYLLNRKAIVSAFDPLARDSFSVAIGRRKRMQYFADQYEALDGADALVVLTDESLFRNPDFSKVARLLKKGAPIFDGRNLYEPKLLAGLGIEYHCVGRTQ